MNAQEKKMKPLDDEIERLEGEIRRLTHEKDAMIRARAILMGGASNTPLIPAARKRTANVKPLILDIMNGAGSNGLTSAEVADLVKVRMPSVGKETVSSVLSRLKGLKALVYDGERYFDARFAPKTEERPFEPRLVG